MDIAQIKEAITKYRAQERKAYEIGLIIEPNEQIVPIVISKIKDIINQHNGNVIEESELGRRTLAYPIRKNRKKYTEGIYKFILFEGNQSTIENLNKLVKIDENVIRYIILRVKSQKKNNYGKKF
ncbi:MAG: 30S ribosomal protein S6 [Brevinematia bacterium]